MDERLAHEGPNVSLPLLVVHDVRVFGSASSQEYTGKSMISGGREKVVFKTNADKKGDSSVQTKGLVSITNYISLIIF